MSRVNQYKCGDCHYIALKRHFSKCGKACADCKQFHREDYVCVNHLRDYCTNDNVVGKIDRTYPACEAEFLLKGTSFRLAAVQHDDYYPRKEDEKKDEDVA